MRINRSLVAASILAFGMFMNPARIYAQHDDENEHDVRPDGRGNMIRNMPHRGAGTQGAVVTGNGINYHNGPVLHSINLYFLWYGDWSKDPTGPAIMNYWAQHIAPSPYFNINTTYGDNSGNVPNAVTFFNGSYSDAGSLGTQLSDNSIATIVTNGINSGALGPAGVADPNGLYMVLTAPGVNETSGFLTQYCGWHTGGRWGPSLTPVQYAFIGNATGPKLSSCAEQTASSPNNDPGADAMISVMTHELEETATDPQGNAWYDSAGEENADKCAWTFGNTFNPGNGSMANVTLGTKNFLIQQDWVNALGGKCVLSWATTPDFSVSISGSPQTVSAGGASSGTYTLTDTPANGFSGTVTWTFSNIPAGITVNAAPGLSGSPATFTLSAASGVAAGTYSVTVTGTSGSLFHSTVASLVVSVPTFSLSITPSSRTVSRPSSGTTTATYTVNVAAVGVFTNPVSLTVTGGTTGVTPNIGSPNPVSPGGSTTLNVAVTSSAKRGHTRTLTVTGTASGTTNKTASATITIP